MKQATYDYLSEQIQKTRAVIIKFDAHMNVGDYFTSKGDLDLDPAENIYDADVLRVIFFEEDGQNTESLDNYIFEKEYFDLEHLAHDIIKLKDEFSNISIDETYDLGQDLVKYLEEKDELIKGISL